MTAHAFNSYEAPASLAISQRETADVLVVSLSGQAGFGHIDELEKELKRISGAAPRAVVLDLSGLTFASSLCLGLMLMFRRAVVTQGGTVQIVCPPSPVRTLFATTGLDQIFNILPNSGHVGSSGLHA